MTFIHFSPFLWVSMFLFLFLFTFENAEYVVFNISVIRVDTTYFGQSMTSKESYFSDENWTLNKRALGIYLFKIQFEKTSKIRKKLEKFLCLLTLTFRNWFWFDSIYDFNFSVNNSIHFSFFGSEVWVFEDKICLGIMLYCL